jgi:beta-galactosidase/beta-glucuronidase
MSAIHSIRLRGPWRYEPLARSVLQSDGTPTETTNGLPPAGKVAMPGDWGATLGRAFRGRVRYRRAFGRPTIEAGERVYLVIEAVDAEARVLLNGQPLGETRGGPARFDVTALLRPRNELMVEVSLPVHPPDEERQIRGARAGLPGGLIGEVRLEIYAAQ